MSAFMKRVFASLVVVAGLVVAGEAPLAGEGVMVNVNMARILRINSPAATVIIGNPAIADVTIQDPKTLILTGKAFGETNLIILDSVGNPIADTLVDVVQQDADLMTIYLGTARTTMVCAPVCQPTPMLGDDPSYTSQAIASSNLIGTAASN
jgi:Flp pilus assembly secretin CpaC